jgi:hypothetical protein
VRRHERECGEGGDPSARRGRSAPCRTPERRLAVTHLGRPVGCRCGAPSRWRRYVPGSSFCRWSRHGAGQRSWTDHRPRRRLGAVADRFCSPATGIGSVLPALRNARMRREERDQFPTRRHGVASLRPPSRSASATLRRPAHFARPCVRCRRLDGQNRLHRRNEPGGPTDWGATDGQDAPQGRDDSAEVTPGTSNDSTWRFVRSAASPDGRNS